MKYKLSEIFEKPISGEWGNELEEGKYGAKVIRTTNFTNMGRLNLNDIVERDIDVEKYKNKLLKLGDIIIEKSGGSPNQPVGRVVIFEENTSEKYFCNNFTSILRPKNIVNAKYSLYLLKDLYNKKRVLKYQNKTTGIINLKLNDYLNNTEIMIPSIEEQIKISTILDKSQELIDKRKEQIEALDELVKSKFIEMFGELETNLKGFQVKTLEEILETIVDCPHSTPKYSDTITPYPCIRSSEIKKGYISWDTMRYLEENDFVARISRIKPSCGDLIFVREGNYGDAIVVPEGVNLSLGQRVVLFRPNYEVCESIFLWAQIKSNSFINQTKSKNCGTTVGRINVKDIKTLKVMVPPIELQNQFADFVKQVDKLKFAMEKSLKELENNFNSLMQKAFKGELFN